MTRPRTRNNVVSLEQDMCFLCNGVIIDGFCRCNIGNEPVEQAPREPQLLKVNANEYIIDSFTTPGVAYPIKRGERGVWMCGCPAYAFNYQCKHIKMLLDTLGTPVAPAAKPETPTKRKLLLEDIFDYEKPMPVSSGRVKESW